MAAVPDALTALLAAARTVPGVSAYRGDQAGTMRTPAVVVGLPTLRWESFCADPTSATFRVALAVSLDEYAMGRLLDLLPAVHVALEDTGASITEATPIPYTTPGGVELVAYQLTTEFPLQ